MSIDAPRPEPFRDLDWAPARAREFGARALDLWTELLEHIPTAPIMPQVTKTTVRAAVARAVPEEPLADDELFSYLRSVLFDNSMYPGNPRFMGYITGPGTVPGAPADLLAAGLNQNVGGWRLAPAATEIEEHLVTWFAAQFGLPPGAGGLMVSGGAMANFVGLKAARDNRAGWSVRTAGVAAGPPLVFYGSSEVHVVSTRGADMLGLGSDAVRMIRVDANYRMRVDLLREEIAADRARGLQPFAVVASAGTVATGAIDPLNDIADICADNEMWFHVDGAYGGPAVLADDLRPLLAGIERADSIAFDPHKWMYTPHSGGCVLVRDVQHLSDAFAVHPTYVHGDAEESGWGIDYHTMGPQFSRGFQSLKVWVSLLAHGRRAYAQRISQDAALARYMARRVTERPDLELRAPVTLSICCFRYVPPGISERPDREALLDDLNERIMTAVQADGRTYFSNAVLDGRFVLRACIVNFRTEASDVDQTLDVTCEIGARLAKEMGIA